MTTRIGLVVMTLATLLVLSGCGVRGPLEPPPGAVAERDAAATPPGSSTAKGHDGFVLDPLL